MRAPTFPLAITIVLLGATLGAFAPPAAAQEGQYALSGRVVSDAGDPVAGAQVSAWLERADGASKDQTTTAEDGTFTLHLDAGKGRLEVWYDAWRQSAAREIAVDADLEGIEIVLAAPPPKTAVIEGRVVDEQGAPVAGATVEVWQGCCVAYPAETRPQTEPAQAPPPSDTGAEGGAGESGASDASAPDGATTRIAPGYYPYDGGDRATTDDDGRYRVATYPGPRQVSIHAKGFAQESFTVEAVEGQAVRGDATLLKVPAADAVVKGRVVDAATGLPLAGAWIYVNNLEWSRWANVESGKDGTFQVTTLPGWAQIGASHHGRGDAVATDGAVESSIAPHMGYERYYAYAQTVKLDSGETVLEIRLQPKPEPSIVLLGYVVDPDAQKGVAGATVSFWNQDTGDWGNAVTDATGSYKILVRAGHYQVHAWADGHLGGAATMTVGEDDAQKRFDLTLPKGTARYAPCGEGDDGCGGYYAMDGDMAVKEGRSAGSESAVAPPASAPAPGPAATRTSGDALSSGSGAMTYQGSGGGLPPYDADAAASQAPASDGGAPGAVDGDGQKVPFAGLALLVAALGAAALALRRRG